MYVMGQVLNTGQNTYFIEGDIIIGNVVDNAVDNVVNVISDHIIDDSVVNSFYSAFDSPTHTDIKELQFSDFCVGNLFIYEECPICLIEGLGLENVILKCGHIFHKKCINVYTKNECPICRQLIRY
jgi:hypothetical protein